MTTKEHLRNERDWNASLTCARVLEGWRSSQRGDLQKCSLAASSGIGKERIRQWMTRFLRQQKLMLHLPTAMTILLQRPQRLIEHELELAEGIAYHEARSKFHGNWMIVNVKSRNMHVYIPFPL